MKNDQKCEQSLEYCISHRKVRPRKETKQNVPWDNPEVLSSKEYPFVAITPRSTII